MSDLMIRTERLSSLLKRFEIGDIRVPAFQQPFAWSDTQVLRLIESVYKGYPIGTMVFWETSEEIFETASSDVTQLPDTLDKRDELPKRPYVTYMIDGTQRFSTLYNCLRGTATDEPHRFNIIFDLDSLVFSHFHRDKLPHNFVHLSSISSPNVFADNHLLFDKEGNFKRLLPTLTDLRERFINYEIVVMNLPQDDANEIISVYESLNMGGRQLTPQERLRVEAQRPKQGPLK